MLRTLLGLCSAAMTMSVLSLSASAAGPEVTSLFPPGGQRGTEVEIQITGTLPTWPIQTESNSGLTVEMLEKKGTARVKIPADAVPGLHWIRFYDDQGAAELRPLVVGTLADVAEKEPNDAISAAQSIAENGTVYGRYNAANDTDTYALSLKAGTTLFALIEANTTHGAPADALMQILDERSFVLHQTDDRFGLDPQLAWQVPADGTYYLRTFCFPATPNSTIRFAGGDDYIYRLTLTTGPTLDYAFPLSVSRETFGKVQLFGWNLPDDLGKPSILPAPGGLQPQLLTAFAAGAERGVPLILSETPAQVEQEPNNVASEANTVTSAVAVSGRLQEPGDVDLYRLTITEAGTLRFQVQSAALGFAVDPRFRILDDAGMVLNTSDDARQGRTVLNDPDVEYAFRTPGDYLLEVTDLFGRGAPNMVYSLAISPAVPRMLLTTTTDRFEIPQDGKLEIPVAVERVNRLPGEIRISAASLPKGVSAETVVSETKGATAKSVKLVLQATGPISGSFRIVGETMYQEQAYQEFAVGTLPATVQTTPDLWLTVQPKKPEEKKPAGKEKAATP